ncbi:hypothetical protein V6N11_051544 [Hibiscus sabdariffa]|uniref:Uncharacterized protein n=1 Tax=Hibiscus sabdariffa TaxID=183260 RepID=A0ABR2U7K5_9ROSI
MVIVTELLLDRTLRKYFLSMRPRCLAMHVAIGFALDITCPMQFLHSNGIFRMLASLVLSKMIGTYSWMALERYLYFHLHYKQKVDAYSYANVLWMPTASAENLPEEIDHHSNIMLEGFA